MLRARIGSSIPCGNKDTMIWTIEKIGSGFKRFESERGRLPTALEIDHVGYLPSSRHIQKKFGGLVKLRIQLGYPQAHFGKGIFRSVIASRVNSRGRTAELLLESALRQKFGEVFVHTEKFFGSRKNRVDFFIYAPDGNFSIDIFYSDKMKTLQSNVNIKMKKYGMFAGKLYLASANPSLSQSDLNAYAESKKRPLPDNIELVTLDVLANRIAAMSAYPNPPSILFT